jgi:hypothetical protein
MEPEEKEALAVFMRLYCSQAAIGPPESQAPVVIHLNRLFRALYATHNDELVKEFGDGWRDYAFLWGPLREMLVLALHTYQVSLGLLFSGNPRESKSLARSALETAVDIHYILLDPKQRFVAYIMATLDHHQKKLQQWGKALGDQPKDRFTESRGVQAAMTDGVAEEKKRWRTTMGKWGLKSVPAWPSSTFDRFRDTGNELFYRSTYALLCSDTHMDATEILNVIRAIDMPDDATRRRFRDDVTENAFGNLVVVLGIILESVRQYAKTFRLPSVARAVDADGTFIVQQV